MKELLKIKSTTKKQKLEYRINSHQQNSEGKSFFDTYYGDMSPQGYFTSTKKQFKDSDYQPSIIQGLESNPFVLIPTVRIAPKVINATAIVGRSTASKVDDVILNSGIKADNLIQSRVIPGVKDGYYRTANVVYTNPIKTIGTIDTVYGGISPEPPVTGTQLLGNRINAWVVEPIKEELDSENE